MSDGGVTFSKIEHTSIRDTMRHQIYELLAAGKLQPGSPLPSEKELVRQFNVSRPALREAIHALVGEGLLDVIKGKGIFISRPTPGLVVRKQLLDLLLVEDYIKDVLETRKIIEPEVAAMFAAQATDADLEKLENILDRVESGELTSKAMWDFHLEIVQVTGNSALVKILQALYEMVLRIERVTDDEQVIVAHRMLLDALKKRDPEIARSAMREHVSLWMRASQYDYDARGE
jgi:GntR family transcriptional repressor for pyruvate dehydrogenase complex